MSEWHRQTIVISATAEIHEFSPVMKEPAVHLMDSQRNGTLYAGVASNFIPRVWRRRNHLAAGSTDKYDVTRLVWFEQYATMDSAIAREKTVKRWNWVWKNEWHQRAGP